MTKPNLVTRLHVLILLVLAALAVMGIATISPLHQFPLHRGMGGAPDWTWPRDLGLAVLPAIAAVLTALAFLASGLTPKPRLERARHLLEPALTLVLGLIAACQLGLVLEGGGSDLEVVRLVSALLAPGLVVFGIVLSEAERHTYAGVRLTWRLDDAAWRPVHRVAGWSYVAGGVCLGALAWRSGDIGLFLVTLPLALVVPVLLAAAATVLWRVATTSAQ